MTQAVTVAAPQAAQIHSQGPTGSFGPTIQAQRSAGPTVQHEMSYALRTVLHRIAADRPVEIPVEVMREARRLLQGRTETPIVIEAVAVWLGGLAAGVNDAPDRDAILGRAYTLVLACQDCLTDDPNEGVALDGTAFSDDALIKALRQFDRWPSVRGLYLFLVDQAKARRELWDAMEIMVGRVDQDPSRPRLVAGSPRRAVAR